ncbi:MAG TPA: F0F1 ATP synthase subunit B [Lacipirellulaceae bacterium]|jgi:F-type H+-transporting ATPase subunit b|nr:F0F1 ATP synthase subunit B [Lacipirellulaceae bacterium]
MSFARFSFAVLIASIVAAGGANRLSAAAPETKVVDPSAKVEAEAEQESGPNPLAFDPDLAIFTAVIFLLLVGILGKFAWPQITAALDERERKISDSIAAAQAQNDAAKKLLAEHEAKLSAAAGEVRTMIEEARRDGDALRKRIEAEGQTAAKNELDRAVREIGRARDAAVQELAVSSANVAVDLARGIVKQDISADRQKQLVHDALGKLTATAPSNN